MNSILDIRLKIYESYDAGFITKNEKLKLLQMVTEDTMYFPKDIVPTMMETNFNLWYKVVVDEALKRRQWEHN